MARASGARAAREAEEAIRRGFRNGMLAGADGGRMGAAGLGYPPDQEALIARQVAELLGYFPTLLLNTNALLQNRIIEISGTVPVTHRGFKYFLPVGVILPHAFPRAPPYVSVRPTPDMVIKHQHPNVAGDGRVVTPYLSQVGRIEWKTLYSAKNDTNQACVKSRLPCRGEWQASCNLVDLVATMVIAFEEYPPLYQRPQQASTQQPAPAHPPSHAPVSSQQGPALQNSQRYQYPPPPPAQLRHAQPPQQSQQQHAPYLAPNHPPNSVGEHHQSYNPYLSSSTSPNSIPMAAMPNGGSQAQQQHHRSPPPPPTTTQRPDEVGSAFKTAAIAGLSRKLQADLFDFSTKATEEIDTLFEAQRVLDSRYSTLKSFEDELVIEREALDKCLTSIKTRTDEVSRWLEENENAGLVEDSEASKSGDDPEWEMKKVDGMFVPKDEIHEALLFTTARDQAIEDTLYALEEALSEGVVGLDDYLRKMRNLSREQFFARASFEKLSTRAQR